MINQLYTVEGENMASVPWQSYPRPQMKRDSFLCLNGQWKFGFGKADRTIIVPFAPESVLSGVGDHGDNMVYEKEFSVPKGFIKERVFLHFGAVDQRATVYLNGHLLGTHVGGYTHFSFEITDHIKEHNLLVVKATDTLDKRLPYGKQRKKRGGMWYTESSGIWQTVWLESTPERYVTDILVKCDDTVAEITVSGIEEGTVTFQDESLPLKNGKAVYKPKDVKKWSPEDPYLYYFTVEGEGDRVESYLAFRKLEIKEINGIKRLCLNSEPYFFNGVLDQGYYPDGILTPASPTCYEKDILLMKKAGFNMLRKHIKVEPEEFYYACDRLGMAVFQDMVNNGSYSFFFDTALPTVGMQKFYDKILHINKETRRNFEKGMEETVEMLKNHPSICYWTVFNEGWGQFNANKMYHKLKRLDSTRFIDTASGWFRVKNTDVESRHVYFKRLKEVKSDKPVVISEFGGYTLKIEGHVFNSDKEYGYKTLKSKEEFNTALCSLFEEQLLPLVEKGVCASVYTQVSDVEDEINGLVTYDRKEEKFDTRIKEINARILERIKK
jgi:beta-galactosidase/beta-glucuronidase